MSKTMIVFALLGMVVSVGMLYKRATVCEQAVAYAAEMTRADDAVQHHVYSFMQRGDGRGMALAQEAAKAHIVNRRAFTVTAKACGGHVIAPDPQYSRFPWR